MDVPPAAEPQIVDNETAGRYEIRVGGQLAGYAEYRRHGLTITFTHTVVEPAFEGRGLASRLVRYALDEARARGLKVRPVCPFFAKYIATHPAYADLLA